MALLPPDEQPTPRLHGPDWQDGKAAVEALVAGLGLERWVRLRGHRTGDAEYRALTAARGLASLAVGGLRQLPILATAYLLARHFAEHDAAVLAPLETGGSRRGADNPSRHAG